MYLGALSVGGVDYPQRGLAVARGALGSSEEIRAVVDYLVKNLGQK